MDFQTSECGLYFKGLIVNLLYPLEYSVNGTGLEFMNLIFVAKVIVQYEVMDWMAEFPDSNPGFVLALQHGKASHSHFLVGKVRMKSSSVFCRILAP